MKAGNKRAVAQKSAYQTYRWVEKAIMSTSARAVNLFVIALMDEAHEHLTCEEVYRAYERFCKMSDEVLKLSADDISDEMITRRLRQIVNDELLPDGSKEKLIEAMNKMQELTVEDE